MSRAFVKDDAPQDDDLPARPVSGRPNYVTRRGLELLEGRVRELKRARADLLKRADDPETRRERGVVDRDLLYYEARLEGALLVDHSGKGFEDARLGAAVEASDAQGKRYRFEIVGEDEADADAGKLNWASPLADALLGRKAGDTVLWEREDGSVELRVISVSYP
ncbi:MAG: GreA/GreB family elongation factor [Elusimicrobiota bacterium]